jgi:AcrR family transcriptional regulator
MKSIDDEGKPYYYEHIHEHIHESFILMTPNKEASSMGTRAESKKIYRDKILTAARDVFATQDFEITTIEQIAERAGVGLGTTYNYFRSKEELYILSMAEDVENSSEVCLEERAASNRKPADIVYDELYRQIKKMPWSNKKMWRIAFPLILGSMRSEKMPIHEVFRADFKMMDRMKEQLHQMKASGLLGSDFDEQTAHDLIFSSFFYHISLYIYSDDATFDETLDRIRKNIAFVFLMDGRSTS